MIKSLKVENFQGIQSAEVTLGKLTVVHGPNESGKTSLAQALDFAADTTESRGTARFGKNTEVVNQNATVCRVAFELDGHVFYRQQERAGGSERRADGLPYKIAEYASALESALGGISSRVFTAALRSGALLDEKPQDLLELLMAVSGTKIGPEDIAAELAPQADALARLKLAMPRTLDGMAKTAAGAVEIRKQGKRDEKRTADELLKVPVVAGNIAAKARQIMGVPHYSITEALSDLRARRDAALRNQAADSGAKEERAKALVARIAELEAVPEEAQPSKTGMAEAAKADSDAALEMVRAQEAYDKAAKAALGEKEFPEGVESTAQSYQDAMNANAAALRALEAMEADRRRLAETILTVRSQADCPCVMCGQVILPGHIGAIEAALQRTADALPALRKEVQETAIECRDAERFGQRIAAVKARIEAESTLPALSSRVAAAKVAREEAAADLKALNEQSARWTGWKTAQGLLTSARVDLEALRAPSTPGPSVSDLDAQIAQAEALKTAAETLARADALQKAADAARATIKDADDVADACGTGGAQARLVARATLPFFMAANRALAELTEGYEIRLDTTDGPRLVATRGNVTLGTEGLSKGRRQSVLYVLQVAVAMLTKAPLVVFDDPENLDEESKGFLLTLAARCVDAGVQVLILTCAPAPQWSPKGVTMWKMDAGTPTRIPEGSPPF